MPLPRRRFLQLAAGAAALPAVTRLAKAQSYPTRPVRIIIGFAAGASGDIAARVLAQALGQRFGQQFIVENRSGAGSNIATNFVAHAPNDGYTLLQGTVANTINPVITPNLGFDFVKDFAPISLFATLPNILVVHPSLGVRTVPELIKLAREKPGQLSYGSAGVGGTSHFTGELFNVMAGTNLVHVPYPGTAQAATDLLSGRVQVMFSPASTVLQFVAEGKLVALASSTLRRASVAPDLPTISEAGLPGFDTSGWFGLLAPAGTPGDIIERLAAASNAAAKSPDVVATLARQGFDMAGGSPEEFAAFIRDDLAKWTRVATAAGLAAGLKRYRRRRRGSSPQSNCGLQERRSPTTQFAAAECGILARNTHRTAETRGEPCRRQTPHRPHRSDRFHRAMAVAGIAQARLPAARAAAAPERGAHGVRQRRRRRPRAAAKHGRRACRRRRGHSLGRRRPRHVRIARGRLPRAH